MMKAYDFLIVGSGLFGAVFAHQMSMAGKKCLVIDKRAHAGGNVYCEKKEDINVHCYGAHIFHTNNKPIWDYVNSFAEFNRYTNSPLASYKGRIYNLPFNMNTFYQLWGVTRPEEARAIISSQTENYRGLTATNLEEQALSMVGADIYNYLIKEYTEKQWGRPAHELPAFIIKRLPLRFTYNNNYFDDKYQGIPIGGYNKIIEGMLRNCTLKLNVDFFKNRAELESLAETVVYTGKLDEYFGYRYGYLEYRSLKFEHEHIEKDNYQGNAVVNYIEKEIPFTRIIEHKHFEFGDQPTTIITREFPQAYNLKNEPYYPINDEKNDHIYQKYQKLAVRCKNVIFGGRLAEFKYYDMHQIVASALKKAEVHISKANYRTPEPSDV